MTTSEPHEPHEPPEAHQSQAASRAAHLADDALVMVGVAAVLFAVLVAAVPICLG